MISDGQPNDCNQLNEAWIIDENGMPFNEASYWAMDPLTDMQPPRGQLSGKLTLISTLDAVQMTYQADIWPDETHLYAATMDDPTQFRAEAHYHYAERLAWLTGFDGSAGLNSRLVIMRHWIV